MTSAAVVSFLRLFEDAGLEVWLDGGWGIDALLETQTRLHSDVDLILRIADVPRLMELLRPRGFFMKEGIFPDSFVLTNGQGLQIDIHAVTFDEEGNGVYRMQNGKLWIYPAEGFTGRGVINGHAVRCLSPNAQVICHAEGYVPTAKDFQDMQFIAERFAIALPPQLRKQLSI